MSLPFKTLGPSLFLALFLSAPVWAQTPQAPKGPGMQFPAASPTATLRQRIGFTTIEITYSRPSAKGRKMLGGINPYGAVWRTGANGATVIRLSTAAEMNGTEVPAGTYALFTIPGENKWTVIINKDAKQFGAFSYDSKDDLVRFDATPETIAQPVETFTIEFGDIRDDSATLNLEWENTRVPIHLEFPTVVPQVIGQIQAALDNPAPKSAGFYFGAANFYFNHGQDLGKCLELVNDMLAQSPRNAFEGEFLKAEILAKQGDKAGAIEAAKAARDGAIKVESDGENDAFVTMSNALIASLGG